MSFDNETAVSIYLDIRTKINIENSFFIVHFLFKNLKILEKFN